MSWRISSQIHRAAGRVTSPVATADFLPKLSPWNRWASLCHRRRDRVTDAFILGGVRTPVGRYGGSLSHVRTDDLLGQTMVAACERLEVPLDRIDDITAGCVNVAHEGMGDIARWGALAAGFPDSVPAVTVNRFCASSLSGTISLAHAIRSGELEVGLAAGVESMSRSGWANMKGEAPFSPRGPVLLLDTMWAGAGGPPNPVLLARNAYVEMIKTAQNVADRYQLSRTEIDAFALRSHHRAAAARDSGRLAAEIHPIDIPGTKKVPGRTFEHDELIRGDTTAGQLAALPPQPNTTEMTAGNSSALSDGASAVLVASEGAAQSLQRTPLARVVASATYALDPQFMGIAPAFAIAKALQRAGLAPTDIDVWEVHEAFAAQALGVLRELANQLDGFVVPDDRLNPNGGAVAIGHPFGSSGTRYVLTLATELNVREVRYGVLGVCVGSGQGVALVLENANFN
jgi:acetyl-CoA acetyltransferase family protein